MSRRVCRKQQTPSNADDMALAIESGSWLTVKALLDAGITLKEPVAKHGAALNIALQFDRPTMHAILDCGPSW